MKWYGYPPPWANPNQNKTSDWEMFVKFQQWTEKQEKKRKKADKEIEDAKKKKESEIAKWPNFSTGQMLIMLVALGPIVGAGQIIVMFYMLRKILEVTGLK